MCSGSIPRLRTNIVTDSMVESTKGQDYFKVGGDQANNTKVRLVWYILK